MKVNAVRRQLFRGEHMRITIKIEISLVEYL